MRRILSILGIGLMAAGAANAQDGFYGKFETPRYDIVRQVGPAEVRDYAPHILAQVSVRGDQSGALGRGFRVLAGYIFGGNDGGASVSMTSPVTQSASDIAMTSPVTQTQSDGVWTVTFMMPTDFTLATLPAPNNEAVQFVQVPTKSMIALEFSGRATTRALEARTAELTQIAAQAGIATTGAPVFLFYDDPFTLPANRRNEVALELR